VSYEDGLSGVRRTDALFAVYISYSPNLISTIVTIPVRLAEPFAAFVITDLDVSGTTSSS
jgi:hypothetical protein